MNDAYLLERWILAQMRQKLRHSMAAHLVTLGRLELAASSQEDARSHYKQAAQVQAALGLNAEITTQEQRPSVDALLGFPTRKGAMGTCSKCGDAIPEEHAPLIVWSQDGTRMWVLCPTCEQPVLRMIRP
jgi:RNA polymerase-binding transcription factor DksA